MQHCRRGSLQKSWTQVLHKDKNYRVFFLILSTNCRWMHLSKQRLCSSTFCASIVYFFFANSLSILRVLHLIINHFRCCKATSHLPNTRQRCQPGWPSSRPLPLRPGAASRGLHGFCSKLRGQSLMLGCCSSLHDLAGTFLVLWQADRVSTTPGVIGRGGDRRPLSKCF